MVTDLNLLKKKDLKTTQNGNRHKKDLEAVQTIGRRISKHLERRMNKRTCQTTQLMQQHLKKIFYKKKVRPI